MFPPENLPPDEPAFVNDFTVAHVTRLEHQLTTLQVVRRYDPDELLRDAVTLMHAFGGNHAVRDRVASFLPTLS